MPTGELPEDFAAQLVEGSADAIVYADAAGVIRFWNAGAARIFGYGAGEALGASLDLIIPERLRPRHWQGYDEVMHGRESRYGHGDLLAVPGLHKDGRQIPLEMSFSPLESEDGLLIINTVRDCSEQMRRGRRRAVLSAER